MTLPAIQSEPAPGPIPEPRVVHNVEIALGYILRLGVAISILLVVIGTCVSFVRHRHDYIFTSYPLEAPANDREAKTASRPLGAEEFPHTIRGLVEALQDLKGRGFVVLGLLVLLATPVVSVATAIIAFSLQKDRAFTIIAGIVLFILCVSFFLGRAEGVDISATSRPATAPAPATQK